jgi:protein gp37
MSSKIGWCDTTWNPVVGCSKVSAGCDNCYAKAMLNRFPELSGVGYGSGDGMGIGWDEKAHFFPKKLKIPFQWKKPRRIFVCSMGDLFHESVTNEQIAAVFGVIAACPQHQFLVLTKRQGRALEIFIESEYTDDSPEAFRQMIAEHMSFSQPGECIHNFISDMGFKWESEQVGDYGRIELLGYSDFYAKDIHWPLPNLWLGVSVEDQKTADERIPLLLQIPAAKRFVSYEPALGPVNIGIASFDGSESFSRIGGLSLVITGSETGPHKRPMDLDWARSVRDQCKASNVPFWFKKDSQGNETLDGVEHHPEFWK